MELVIELLHPKTNLPDKIAFLFYLFVAGIVETGATTITYYLPSYIHEYLNQSIDMANSIVSFTSLMIASCALLSLGK